MHSANSNLIESSLFSIHAVYLTVVGSKKKQKRADVIMKKKKIMKTILNK